MKAGDWNWQGAVVGLALLGLVFGDLALLGHTAVGYGVAAVIVVVAAIALRFGIWPGWLQR